MTALFVAQLKPILLFLLIGSIVGLARLQGKAARALRGSRRMASVRA